MQLWLESHESSLGTILLVTFGEQLVSLDFSGYESRMHRLLEKRLGSFLLKSRPTESGARQALDAYLRGDLNAFQSIALHVEGTTFQKSVWTELMQIAPGTTCSYQTIATKLGKPGASRAVGTANGSNPIALAIPCHRVIAASGALGGYAGGIEKKKWLLSHERKWA